MHSVKTPQAGKRAFFMDPGIGLCWLLFTSTDLKSYRDDCCPPAVDAHPHATNHP